ncbi:hypothetical protein ACA910_014939 [Epithemia clementina (nom. ined.)]
MKGAQLNKAKYAPLFVAILVFCHFHDANGECKRYHLGGTLAVLLQVGYFWCCVGTGYPSIPTANIATIWYGAFQVSCVGNSFRMPFKEQNTKTWKTEMEQVVCWLALTKQEDG